MSEFIAFIIILFLIACLYMPITLIFKRQYEKHENKFTVVFLVFMFVVSLIIILWVLSLIFLR